MLINFNDNVGNLTEIITVSFSLLKAWLKFYVTDQLLTKSIEEPYWFDGDDLPDVTTEPMSRQIITIPPITHESSIELVNGLI